MKVGDEFPVTIEGLEVARARVREVSDDGRVWLVVPGKVVEMQYRTSTTLETPTPVAAEGASHVLLTDQVADAADLATQQVPGGEATPPAQPETIPTEPQKPTVPEVPQEVEDAVEREASA